MPDKGPPINPKRIGHQPNSGYIWMITNPRAQEPKPPRKPKKIAKNLLETTCPLNIKILCSKSPPVCFQPLKLSYWHKSFKTLTGCWEDEISTTVVLSLLEALRKKNNPMAKRIVSNNVEFKV